MSISTQEMAKTVAALTAPGKGILAADESAGTIEKRLKAVNVTSTEPGAITASCYFPHPVSVILLAASSCSRRPSNRKAAQACLCRSY